MLSRDCFVARRGDLGPGSRPGPLGWGGGGGWGWARVHLIYLIYRVNPGQVT